MFLTQRLGFSSRRLLSTRNMASVPFLLTPTQYKDLPESSTVPLDVSWHMPNTSRNGDQEYLDGPRIPRARRWNMDEIAELRPDKNPLSLTHMLPTIEVFKEACEKRGIKSDTHVVVYDTLGIFASPRALYTFKTLGHDKVSILNGGLPRWIAEGNEGETGPPKASQTSEYSNPSTGKSKIQQDAVIDYDGVTANSQRKVDDPKFRLLLDHRPQPRWEGTVPEPRPGIPSGHIPNSLPMPFPSYLNPASDAEPYTSYKPVPELKEILIKGVGGQEVWKRLNSDRSAGLIFSCGSGMTAAVGWVASEMVKDAEGSNMSSTLYDESWTGYAMRPESVIKTIKDPTEKQRKEGYKLSE